MNKVIKLYSTKDTLDLGYMESKLMQEFKTTKREKNKYIQKSHTQIQSVNLFRKNELRSFTVDELPP